MINLSEADKRIYDTCEEGPETYWDILGPGCSWQEQHFKLEQPLGYGDRSNTKQLSAKPGWALQFEITAVYPGAKYDDTAITEIYFDGIDVH
ncbi:hypothetical protein BC349_12245 [Flavihumibacter stibioxidans]|uniref:NAD glycohydrolase translocation F5/8 type C domain-containing protein n=1 Tax=Flavihumibacter stibioxidans TaxID=1834163 RepID=A0ABR7M9V5_9BACT|nr:hypothetical protein [Flavihumibacter stibioxidans]MBC6491823.1 hypothetical protein [Flavihumibacter stibioxidans]